MIVKIAVWLIFVIFNQVIFDPAASAANFDPPLTIARIQARNKCDFQTYIDDADPDGTNIRRAADKNSVVLKRLKSAVAVVTVTGYSGGWFEIAAAVEVGSGDSDLFQGRGWIHSSLLGMRVAESDARLYAEPKTGSRVLKKLKAEESPLKLIACQGKWVKVRTGGKIGWLAPGGQCGNFLTTCS